MQSSPQPKIQTKTILIIFVSCLAMVACLCLCVAGLAGLVAWGEYNEQRLAAQQTAVTLHIPTLTATSPTITPTTAAPGNGLTATPSTTPLATPTATVMPTPTPAIAVPASVDQRPVPARAYADLDRLLQTAYPPQDYYETATRLGKRELGSRTVTVAPYNVNDRQTFILDSGTIEATLLAVTDNVYFWSEDGLNFNQTDVAAVIERFDGYYYPRVTALFGQEWRPGIDNDPRFSILHLASSGDERELGYFSSVDQYPRSLYRDSNEQEIVYLNMGNLTLGSDLYYGTLVHELQHLIQWYVDPNETTWLNEGLSQLAELYVGLETATSTYYLEQPGIRLNTWNYDEDVVDAHYSAAYLYCVYIWEQLGDTALQELVHHQANGLASVWSVLQGYAPERSLEQFTADWAVANYLDDNAAGDRYHYRTLDLRRPSLETRVRTLPFDDVRDINQFGVHYIDLDFRGQATITFAGSTMAELIDAPPRSGEQMWLAPGQDETSAQLTAAFDLTGLRQASLRFSAWYDLEENWDFAYVSASSDGGVTWELLAPSDATPGEFGPAFSGRSQDVDGAVNGWVKESLSLNRYAGQETLIRFEVLTDSAVVGRGFAIDDITIPELDYYSDVEQETDGWQAHGFVQTGWQVPQQWAVQLIHLGPVPETVWLPLNELNQGQWTIEIGKGGGILVVIALTPFIDEPATYWLNLEGAR